MYLGISKKLMAAMVLVVVLNSCKKYEDGPNFTLRTAMNRINGDWELVRSTPEVDLDGITLIWEFDKDFDFKWKNDYGTYAYTYAGEWEWEDNKDALEIVINNMVLDAEIKKLTKDELDLEIQIPSYGYTHTWEFEKQD